MSLAVDHAWNHVDTVNLCPSTLQIPNGYGKVGVVVRCQQTPGTHGPWHTCKVTGADKPAILTWEEEIA